MALKRVVGLNNYVFYTLRVLIASMDASIFLSACTRPLFPVEIFISRDVAQVSAMCIVSSTCPSCCSSMFY